MAFSEISKKLTHCGISVAGVFSSLSLLNIAISCTARETYAGALLDAFPLSRFLARLDSNMKKQKLPIVSIVFMSAMTIPFSILVEWSGLLTVIQQMIQIAAYIALHFLLMVKKMKKEEAALKTREENIELTAYDSIARMSRPDIDSIEDKELNRNEEDDEENLTEKFVGSALWRFVCH